MTIPTRSHGRNRLSLMARLGAAVALGIATLAAGTQIAAASTRAVLSVPQPTGAAVQASAPEVYAGFTDNLPFISALVSKKLLIPTGTYTAVAKLVVTTTGSSAEVNCRLSTTSAGDADESRVSVSSANRSQTMTLQFNTINNASQDVIALSCTRSAAATGLTLTWIKIAAIRVADPNHLHNGPLL